MKYYPPKDEVTLSKYDQMLVDACIAGDVKSYEEAIKNGANIDFVTEEGKTPLIYAVESGKTEIVKFLLEDAIIERISLNTSTPFAGPPLYIACSNGDTEMVKLLLNHGAAVDQQAYPGYMPIVIAAASGNKEIIELLLKHGADINQVQWDGFSPIGIAASQNDVDLMNFLLEKGAKAELQKGAKAALKVSEYPLINAANIGHANLITQRKQIEVMKLLLKNGAKVDQPDAQGDTALIYALKAHNNEMAKFLFQNGADINLKSGPDGNTALHRAILNDKSGGFTHALLDRGVRFDIKSGKVGEEPGPTAFELVKEKLTNGDLGMQRFEYMMRIKQEKNDKKKQVDIGRQEAKTVHEQKSVQERNSEQPTPKGPKSETEPDGPEKGPGGRRPST